jgi:hypothetical protein
LRQLTRSFWEFGRSASLPVYKEYLIIASIWIADYFGRERVTSLRLDTAAKCLPATWMAFHEKITEVVFEVSIGSLECFYEAIYGKVGGLKKPDSLLA